MASPLGKLSPKATDGAHPERKHNRGLVDRTYKRSLKASPLEKLSPKATDGDHPKRKLWSYI